MIFASISCSIDLVLYLEVSQIGKIGFVTGTPFSWFLSYFLNHAGWLLWKTKYFDFGARGVEIFFVLSGFWWPITTGMQTLPMT